MQNVLIVEIVKGHDTAPKRVSNFNGQERVSFEQKAYIYNGGAFPQQIIISHDTLSDALEVGRYSISLDSFQSNKYGKLELSPYNTKFIRLAA